jgi:F-type H+-transporting ATPase subunit delta
MEENFKASHRYALSLLESSIEKKNLEKIFNDMQLIVNTLKKSKDLQVMLQSPVIRPELKEKVMTEIFQKKIDNDSLSFIKFIISKRREQILLSIASRFLILHDEHIELANVDVKTAFEFSDDQKKSLQKKIEEILNKKARLSFKVEPELIGGFVAKVDDTLYDASLKHQIEILKKQFLKGSSLLN